MARPNVPQFGEWDSEGNVPYTVFFEKARKNKGGKMINPNDPSENPDMFPISSFSDPDPTPARPPSRQSNPEPAPTRPPSRQSNQEPAPTRPPSRQSDLEPTSTRPPSRQRVHQEEPVRHAAIPHQHSREDSEFRQQFADSPARNRNGGRVADSTGGGSRGGTGSGRPARHSGGTEHSFERSPLHPYHQARLAGGKVGSGSPRPGETLQGTPGRTRMKPKASESPARDVIPPFGEWDVNDPQSADNFTHIFNNNTKAAAAARENNSAPSPFRPAPGHNVDDEEKASHRCCFPWGRK